MADHDVLSVVNNSDHAVIVSNRYVFPAGETVEVTVEQQQFVMQILANRELEVLSSTGEDG
jgi:ABC-type transporter Mla maintaining outer membrane lipid asymmetry ATPase subunit MlaF